jgi:hypothetical protein
MRRQVIRVSRLESVKTSADFSALRIKSCRLRCWRVTSSAGGWKKLHYTTRSSRRMMTVHRAFRLGLIILAAFHRLRPTSILRSGGSTYQRLETTAMRSSDIRPCYDGHIANHPRSFVPCYPPRKTAEAHWKLVRPLQGPRFRSFTAKYCVPLTPSRQIPRATPKLPRTNAPQSTIYSSHCVILFPSQTNASKPTKL